MQTRGIVIGASGTLAALGLAFAGIVAANADGAPEVKPTPSVSATPTVTPTPTPEPEPTVEVTVDPEPTTAPEPVVEPVAPAPAPVPVPAEPEPVVETPVEAPIDQGFVVLQPGETPPPGSPPGTAFHPPFVSD